MAFQGKVACFEIGSRTMILAVIGFGFLPRRIVVAITRNESGTSGMKRTWASPIATTALSVTLVGAIFAFLILTRLLRATGTGT
jgi:hypothetical protein